MADNENSTEPTTDKDPNIDYVNGPSIGKIGDVKSTNDADCNSYKSDEYSQRNEGINTSTDETKGVTEPLLPDGSSANHKNVTWQDGQQQLNSEGDRTIDQNHCHGKPDLERATSCYDNAPDGGWGWVVTFSAFMVGVILDGISFSFGIFFKDLLIHFRASKSLTSWIISVFNGTYLGLVFTSNRYTKFQSPDPIFEGIFIVFLGPLFSVMVSIFGCRRVAIFGSILSSVSIFLSTWSPNVQVMILLYGLLGGTGLGLLYLPAIVTVGHYFKKKRALATGIAVCGSGIGAFVFAPLSEILIEIYSWQGAMWIIAGIALNGVPIGALLRPLEGSEEPMISKWRKSKAARKQSLKKENGTGVTLLPDKSQLNGHDRNVANEDENQKQCCDMKNMFDIELLKSCTFLVYGCSCFLCMFGFFIPFTYIPDLADGFGMTSHEGAALISIIGILNTFARILVGYIADRPWADSLLINSIALFVGGVATMFVPFYSSFGILAAYSVVFGISIAVFVSLRSVIMAELLGIEKLTSSFGLVTMCQGLSSVIGTPIAGALSDDAGDYKGAFFMAGAAIALSGAICFPLRRISRWEIRHKSGSNTAGPLFASDLELKVKG